MEDPVCGTCGFLLFENIKCHQVKSDEVHHVFGKLGVLDGVFISFSQFVIVSDDAVHLIPHGADNASEKDPCRFRLPYHPAVTNRGKDGYCLRYRKNTAL